MCLFWRRSRKASKLWVTGLCEGNSPVTGEFPAQRASDAKDVSIWWHHHASHFFVMFTFSYIIYGPINQSCNIIYGKCKSHEITAAAEIKKKSIWSQISISGWLCVKLGNKFWLIPSTILVLKVECSVWTCSIPWLMMTWLHMLPGHHQSWHMSWLTLWPLRDMEVSLQIFSNSFLQIEGLSTF